MFITILMCYLFNKNNAFDYYLHKIKTVNILQTRDIQLFVQKMILSSIIFKNIFLILNQDYYFHII